MFKAKKYTYTKYMFLFLVISLNYYMNVYSRSTLLNKIKISSVLMPRMTFSGKKYNL